MINLDMYFDQWQNARCNDTIFRSILRSISMAKIGTMSHKLKRNTVIAVIFEYDHRLRWQIANLPCELNNADTLEEAQHNCIQELLKLGYCDGTKLKAMI